MDKCTPPDSPAPGPPAAVAATTPTTRRLADNSLSANTREAYTRALRQFDAWRGLDPATDATLAAYLGWLFEHGRAPATAALAVAAVTFRATLTGTTARGPQTDRVLAGFRRDGADRGRGQAAPLTAASPPSSPPRTGLAGLAAGGKRPPPRPRGAPSIRPLLLCCSRAGCAAVKRLRSNGAT